MDHEFSRSAVKVFKALADPTRYSIVVLLACNEELGCGDFEDLFDKSKPAMSHHYRVLENAGLIRFRKDGLRVYYHLQREQLERFVPQFFQAHCGGAREAGD